MADLVAGRTSSSSPPLQCAGGEEDGAADGIKAETPSLGCCGWFWRESIGCALLNLKRGSWFRWSFFGKGRGQRLWFSFCPENGETPRDGSGGLSLFGRKQNQRRWRRQLRGF
uniref:Uncharacterized protein n=1 Tax=Populus alba TaxID=43335 RepID=A0A4U5M9T5_POPAL|nr:hypothetical protein D5086_0000317700 [Populus alba]